MRAVIIGSGDIKNYEYIKSKLRKTDFIICADGGYNHAVNMGITPDVLIGDFDSAKGYEVVKDRIEYPARKDFTDGELAVSYALEKGFCDIVLLAMSGDRLDHTAADIFLLDKCARGVLIDDNNEVYMLKDSLSVKGKKGQTISVIPLTERVEGVTTSGLEYPLNNETIFFASSRSVSNVMTDEECSFSITSGKALVIKVEKV